MSDTVNPAEPASWEVECRNLVEHLAEAYLIFEMSEREDVSDELRKLLTQIEEDVKDDFTKVVGQLDTKLSQGPLGPPGERAWKRLKKRKEKLLVRAQVDEVDEANEKLKAEWKVRDEEGRIDQWHSGELGRYLGDVKRAAKRRR